VLSPDAEDIVVYGSTLWDTPSLTDHHLARALTAYGRVLFVETPTSLLYPLRAGVDRAAVRRTLSNTRHRLHRDGGVDVLRLLALPPRSSRSAERLSTPWIRAQMRGALRRSGMRPTLVVGARPATFDLGPGAPPFRVALVKDWLQAGGHLTGLDGDLLRERELASWRAADLVCAVSSRLRDRLADDGIPSVLLRHGSTSPEAHGTPAPTPPEELARLPKPILGAVGRIDPRWAFDALEDLARARPDASLALIGPLSPKVPHAALARLTELPNVHRFDAVPGPELPAWLDALDCCLVPYSPDEWQQWASPLKVWDYFRAGKPVVATGAPAMGEFPEGLIHFAASPAELPGLVEAALGEDPATGRRLRTAYAATNTWDDRAAELMRLVEERRSAGRPTA
jgi:glycosyltransferase involved in cell wall biosynthesis